MLVVSRKQNQQVVFPNLGITVDILRVAGKVVRLGVDAPPDVRVLRSELIDKAELDAQNRISSEQRHARRNHLHTVQLALHLLQKQLEAGHIDDAERSLAQALETFHELDHDASPTTRVAEDATSTPPVRALLVEDNGNERELLAGYLRLCGYEVDTVEDGVCAMQYLATHPRPDVVLLDMQMPRMNGCDTVSAIRRNPAYQGIQLFAVSGADQETMRVPMGKRGVNRWFSKPLNPEEFASQLRSQAKAGFNIA